ncbi:GTPase HflX [Candidatus Peregrinibacteria bacterium]|nr:GTPase HflX [Candidatus Peregrinibacteria bacterium]
MNPRVILVDIVPFQITPEESLARLNELENLVVTYGGFVVVRKLQKRQMPDYRYYVGKGKVDEIEKEARDLGAEYVIVNNILKPHQIYNLESRFEKHGIKIWDRIDLILKIFEKHAVTREAKLQIELAQLRHFGPRIFKMGVGLNQQTGGGAITRGKGETNIEIMKRHIARKENQIKKDLKKIEGNQACQRAKRADDGFKTVAIVGYTNAGKSALLNALTRKGVKVKDELFATLDTRLGKLYLPEKGKSVLLSDTIGFIRDLPPSLIHAFHSTLAETIHADLIVMVIDMNDMEMEWKIKTVHQVLGELGCGGKKILYVFNKIDLPCPMPKEDLAEFYKAYSPTFVSAEQKTNLEELKNKIARCV